MKTKFALALLTLSAAGLIAAGTIVADDNSMSGPAMKGPAMTAPSMSGTSGSQDASSMMQNNTMTADPQVGHMLRYAASAAHKVIFTDLKSAEAYAEKGPTVLFFAADWCPYCQADLRDINQNGAQLDSDITIVVVDYDKAKDLEAKYGVTAQDTYVQINPMGSKVTIWNGGGVDVINKRVVRM